MAEGMTKRERVERTMSFEETDRVLLYDLLRNDAAFVHRLQRPMTRASPSRVAWRSSVFRT